MCTFILQFQALVTAFDGSLASLLKMLLSVTVIYSMYRYTYCYIHMHIADKTPSELTCLINACMYMKVCFDGDLNLVTQTRFMTL